MFLLNENMNKEAQDLVSESTEQEVTVGTATAEGDRIIAETALALGLVDEVMFSESYTSASTIKIDAKSKIGKLEKQSAIVVAREGKDADYEKMARLNRARLKLKSKLQKKYASQAKARAREIISGMRKDSAKSKDNAHVPGSNAQ